MPKPGNLEKATLTELWPDSNGKLQPKSQDGGDPKKVIVQFNPQSLKVGFTNQNASSNQAGGGASQFIGQSTTKLALELWFDVQLPLPEGTEDPKGDVRNLTREVAYFMTPQEATQGEESGLLPPGVQFLWGTFLFKGTVDQMDETLEFFSEEGRPLRALVSLTISKQDLSYEFENARSGAAGAPGGRPAGTTPMAPAKQGDTLQQVAARAGHKDWKPVALANGIENPRIMPPGKLLDVSANAGVSSAVMPTVRVTPPIPVRR